MCNTHNNIWLFDTNEMLNERNQNQNLTKLLSMILIDLEQRNVS